MKNLKSFEIRRMWLDFFASKNHEVIKSSPLVPHDDPTLLWINAGVAPLKKYFDGRETPKNKRMTNAQKCIRTNDIDNVGRTSRHHTYFEMMGNFSIGDYFRDDAIKWATELLFDEKWFAIPKDLIYITYYPDDTDTFNRWIECGVNPNHLIPLKGNFWEIGEGPCGPDTEIFFDRGEKYDPEGLGEKLLREDLDNDRYIEIWNIVLSQFNSTSGLDRSKYPELPSKNIDTGSGLERLACIFQGTESNFETDLFMPYIKFVEDLSGIKYEDNKMAFRVIADHVRSVSFAIADGAVLSNEGRGYVLRRLLRRAVRYGKKLGLNEPFLYKMVPLVISVMEDYYPYLKEKETLMSELIKKEEISFLKTLENGEKRLLDIINDLKNKNIDTLSGKDAFVLYDTFGFPFELTLEACCEQGINVLEDDFKEELKNQKELSRSSHIKTESMNVQNEDYLAFNKESKFIGYDTFTSNSKVIGLFKNGKKIDTASNEVVIVFDKTPFYAEMGGQVADNGEIIINNNSYDVINVFRLPNGEHAHVVDIKDEKLKLDDEVILNVDQSTRQLICMNHSATHILNESLRKVLGTHVSQHGSLVSSSSLRFDFNHYNNISKEDVLKVESLVNQEIKNSHLVVTKVLPIDEAKKLGAQAVFGEKYGDVVRVVDMDCAIEFCGGTHVKNTSEIKKFAVTNIESKGSGIFRIEGSVDTNIVKNINKVLEPIIFEFNKVSSHIDELLELAKKEGLTLNVDKVILPTINGTYQDIINHKEALELLRNASKTLEKEYNLKHRESNVISVNDFINKVNNINGINVLIETIQNSDINACKDLIDNISNKYDKCLVFIACISNDKVIFICKSKNTQFNAGTLVKEAAIITGGNGGGRNDFAQAGGKDLTKVNLALDKIRETIK